MKKLLLPFAFCLLPFTANAGLVDALNLAPLVPLVLDALMMVATTVYDFFVGNGTGIIYVLMWGWIAFWVFMYLVKMYFPANWAAFFGFSGGGAMWSDKTPGGMTMALDVLKPMVRGIIAATFLLQVKPVYVTNFLINPFLQFGAIYTEGLTSAITTTPSPIEVKCPDDVVTAGWISEESCNFLVRPVSDLANANNQIIKQGFNFLGLGAFGGTGNGFMYIITGLLLIATFVASNFFMGLLVIQGIFELGMALVLYPFQVLTWVIKTDNKSGWMDMWPAFSGVIDALRKLVITMIACAFILIINIAVIHALFIPDGEIVNFGEHSIVWLTALLTFFLMHKIYSITREYLNKYASGMDKLYTQVGGDVKKTWGGAKSLAGGAKKIFGKSK